MIGVSDACPAALPTFPYRPLANSRPDYQDSP